MTPERWQQVNEVFHSALEREPNQRAIFLGQVCAGDEELRIEVESLIRSHQQDSSFIDEPALRLADESLADDHTESAIGQAISHYKIIKILGAGGMGKVYLAQDDLLNRKVAIKLLPSSLNYDKQLRARFIREAQLASGLDHPNICTVYEVGESAGRHFIVMQYVEGETLKQVIGERPLGLDSLLSISLQVADALAAAHSQGIIHRDIKSSNIIITPWGQAKVLDFGLAKLLEGSIEEGESELTHSGVMLGTPSYMSPEQARGERVDARSDIFSFGVVMYEMASGRVAFKGKSQAETMNAVINEPHRPLTELNKNVPPRLSGVIDRALAKETKDRYQTMQEVQQQLRQVAQAVGLTSSSVPYIPPGRRRSPWRLGRAGSLIGLAMEPERWKQIDQVLEAALDRAPSQRAAFLNQACAGDDALRREVESLLSSDKQASSFIESPAFEVAAELLADDQTQTVVGQQIGHYRVLSLLGTGGMGEVYLAQDTKLGREIALKLLPTVFTRDEDRLRRFEQEARAASALNHPNVCVIHEVGETAEGRHYIAMEYIDGVTLRQRMTDTRLTLSEVLDVAVQVASGLGAAHEVGVMHRDIKPENIMLRRDGYVKVLDFGLAKLTEQPANDVTIPAEARAKTDTGVVMGTSSYMSPEQARGLPVDGRTDIWSLGVVIYEMVAGEAPFKGETTSDVIVSILDREPQPLEHCRPAVPAELQEIVSKTLSKSREKRYQTIEELAGNLKSLKQELEYAARNETAGELTNRTGKQVKRRTSGAKYLISGIKRHQKAVALTVAMLITVLAASAYFHFAGSQKTIDSLAALPFVNVGADANTEYLSDGITESLINSLSQLPDLKVISFSSVSRYRGQQIDPQAVGRALGVRALLVGKVMQHGDDLFVSAELVDTLDNRQIWGEQYNRNLSGLLALQKEISRAISDKLRLRLSGEQKDRLTKRYTESTEAYQLYMKGRYHWNKWSPEGWQKSIEYFQQAIEKDPGYALAYVGVSNAYNALGFFDVMLPREAWSKTEEAAVKALEIDDTLGEAHAALGGVKYLYGWDWAVAERELKRAIELNPNDEVAHTVYAYYLQSMGRANEGLAEMRRASELDPLSIRINGSLENMLAFSNARQYDQAIEQFQKTIELEPNKWNLESVYWRLAVVYENKGMYEEALAAYQKSLNLSGDSDLAAALEQDYKKSGLHEAVRVVLKARLQKMRDASKRERVPPLAFGLIYAELGEKEQAFEWLEKAYEEHSSVLVHLGDGLACDCGALRSDPRFADLLRRIGLPPP